MYIYSILFISQFGFDKNDNIILKLFKYLYFVGYDWSDKSLESAVFVKSWYYRIILIY